MMMREIEDGEGIPCMVMVIRADHTVAKDMTYLCRVLVHSLAFFGAGRQLISFEFSKLLLQFRTSSSRKMLSVHLLYLDSCLDG